MSNSVNVSKICVSGNVLSDVQLNYNPYSNKTETGVTQQSVENYMKNFPQAKNEDFDFNKKYAYDMANDSNSVEEFVNNVAFDKTYNIKFEKTSSSTVKLASDAFDNVNFKKVFIGSFVETYSGEKFQLTGPETIVIPSTITILTISENIDFFKISSAGPLDLRYPKFRKGNLTDTNRRITLRFNNSASDYYNTDDFRDVEFGTVCKKIYIGPKFFEDRRLRNVEPGEFGDFTNAPAIVIEEDDLNCNYAGDLLVTEIKRITHATNVSTC